MSRKKSQEKSHRIPMRLACRALFFHLVGGSSAGYRSSRRGKKKKMQKSYATDPKQSKPSKVDKSQPECFFCKKLGH